MMYRLIPVALLIGGVAAAQVPGAAAKRAAQNAANASNAQLSQQTGQPVPAPKGAAPTTSSNSTTSKPAPAPAASQKPATPTTTPAQPAASSKAPAKNAPAQNAPAQNAPAQNAQPQNAQPQKDTAATPQPNAASAATGKAAAPKKDSVLVMRESYEYSRDGRRDPFVSLMTTSDLRPVLSDLRLTGVLYDLSQRRHIAMMRDENGGAQWRVTTGMTLGRMRVSAIRPKVVVFTIEEFGFSRQDSLILGDSTRVRSK